MKQINEMNQIRWSKQDEANKLARQTNHILNFGGFAVKHWTISDPAQNPNTNFGEQTTTNESFKKQYLKEMQYLKTLKKLSKSYWVYIGTNLVIIFNLQ